MLSQEQTAKLAAHLRLADGFIQTVQINASSSEYDIRNSLSRLYYGFFHASLARLISVELDVEHFSRSHGRVHDEVERIMGKWMGRLIRDLYHSRRVCDYEADMLQKRYEGNVEEARKVSILLVKRAKKHFYWMYQEARQGLLSKI